MAKPIRIGILNDMSEGPPSLGGIEEWLRRTADAYLADGRLDRPLEFVNAWGLGLPTGTAAAVERAYEALVAEDVLLIVGPAIGDNAIVATPCAERHRVPAINWAGSERARSDYMFHLQVGSHEDESILLARHVAALGATTVGVVYDRSPIGRRHLDFLQAEADRIGLRIGAAVGLPPLADDADAAVGEALGGNAEALVYLGLGIAVTAVARAARARGWTGPCAMNTAGIRGYQPAFGRAIDGWTYVDMHADGNATLNALCARLAVDPPQRLAAAKGHDMGRLVAEGIARAPELTRDGVRLGLEAVKWLAAAEGEDGTLLGFGRHDRGALHGRYLVLRRWSDGRSIEARASKWSAELKPSRRARSRPSSERRRR